MVTTQVFKLCVASEDKKGQCKTNLVCKLVEAKAALLTLSGSINSVVVIFLNASAKNKLLELGQNYKKLTLQDLIGTFYIGNNFFLQIA